MKKLIALIGVAVLSLATALIPENASAQTPTYSQNIYTPTNIPPVGNWWPVYSSSNAVCSIDASRSQVITLQATGSAQTIGATNIEYWAPSVDGVYYDTNVADCIVFSNAVVSGQFTNTAVKSFTTYGVQSYKLILENVTANTGYYTNGPHSYGLKISSP